MSTLHESLEFILHDTARAPLAVCVGAESSREFAAWANVCIPEGWRRTNLLASEWLGWASAPPAEPRVLILAPMINWAEVPGAQPGDLRQDGWRGGATLAGAMLLRAITNAHPGDRIAALLPSSAFAASHSEHRTNLLEVADVRLLAEGERAWSVELGLHSAFRLSLLCVEGRAPGAAPGLSRFLRLPDEIEVDALRKELRALFKQEGGRTPHGFVVREPLDPSRPLQFAAFDPARKDRQAQLRTLGVVRRLDELVEIRLGRFHPGRDADRLGSEGARIITGRDVALGSELMMEERVASPEAHHLLQPGDICVAAISAGRGRPLRVRRVAANDLPLVAANSVLVLSPRAELDELHIGFLVDYLRSPRAAALLQHETTGGPHIRSRQLAELAVPVPDDTLLSALADLRATERQLHAWARQVEAAINGVLDDTAAEPSVLALRSTGQLLRQRVAAARQLDDLSYRIRDLFPFPVALPWRRALTGSRDTDGYKSILECAESLTGYLAVLSILLAREVGVELGAVTALRNKLAETAHGVSMSDWTAIVLEVTGNKVSKRVGALTPFVELTELMTADTRAHAALAALTAMRNDFSHNRGPGGGQIQGAVDDAQGELASLYEACDWLCDYPVRLVERVEWDSYSDSGRYQYRELVGDHYLVPQAYGTTHVATLNVDRLYVLDRLGALHLMSPLVHWHECDVCHVPSAFFLDGYERDEGRCRLRAMDHNHTIRTTEVAAPLRKLGLVPA